MAAGDTLCPFSRKRLETADLKSCGYHVGHHWGFLEIVRVEFDVWLLGQLVGGDQLSN